MSQVPWEDSWHEYDSGGLDSLVAAPGMPVPSEADTSEERKDAQWLFDKDVADELRRLRVRESARELLTRERLQAGAEEGFDAGTLAELLERPQGPAHRIAELIPANGGTLIVAQRKTGKTTLILNLARCLLTGENFLDRFPVRPVEGNVAMLNFEVSGHTLAQWADEIGVPADRLFIVTLRGRRNPLSDPHDRGELAELLRSHAIESLIVDPFSRAYDGTSQNDPGEVGSWLNQLDVFTRAEVGAKDLILAAHAGWNGERSRGSTALEDWADSIVTLTRDPEDESQRFLKAMGRDVDVEEDQLRFDKETRWLSLTGNGSRKTAASTRRLGDLVEAVVKAATVAPGITGSGLGDYLRNQGHHFQKGDERKAAAAAVEAGRLRIQKGLRGAHHYFATAAEGSGDSTAEPSETQMPRPAPTCPAGTRPTYPDPSLIGGVGQGGTSGAHLPRDLTIPKGETDYRAIGADLFRQHSTKPPP